MEDMFSAYLYVTPLELNISTRCLFFLPPAPLSSSFLPGLDSDLYTAAMVEGQRSIESYLPTLLPTNRLSPKKKFRWLGGIWNIDHPISWAAEPVWLSEALKFSKEVAPCTLSLLMMRSRLWGRSSQQTYVHT